MANAIEKRLTPKERKNLKMAIITGSTFFIALRGNEFFEDLFDLIPFDGDGLFAQAITFAIIILIFTKIFANLDDWLDGK